MSLQGTVKIQHRTSQWWRQCSWRKLLLLKYLIVI